MLGDEYKYKSTDFLTHKEDLHDRSLNPLASAEGIVVFKVPDFVKDSDDSLLLTIKEGSDTASFNLR